MLVAGGILKTMAFIVISPLLGFFLGSLLMVLTSRLLFPRHAGRLDRWFRRLQLLGGALQSGAYTAATTHRNPSA